MPYHKEKPGIILELDMRPMATKKQLGFIEEIQCYVNDYFDGDTKEEASRWIDSHIDEFNFAKKEDRHY